MWYAGREQTIVHETMKKRMIDGIAAAAAAAATAGHVDQ